MKKQKGHLIKTVKPDSIAEEMGIEPGDRLLEINGETVEDIFDYQYMIEEEYVEVLIAKPSGEEWLLRNTWYPREAKRRAMLRPIPREEPVMRMVFRAMNVPPLSAVRRKGISPDPDIIIIPDNHC